MVRYQGVATRRRCSVDPDVPSPPIRIPTLWHLHCNFDSAPRLTGDSVLLPSFRSIPVLALAAVISIPAVAAAQHRGGPGSRPGPPAQSAVVGASYGYPGFWYGWGAPYGQWAPYGPVPYGPYYPYPYVVDPFSATVKFTVSPKDAEVYVDGALAGTIDDFDGRFQSLKMPPGSHEIVVYRQGYRSVREHMYIESYDSKKLKFDLEKLGAGEQQDARPEPPPLSEAPRPMRPDPRMPPPPEARVPAENQAPTAQFGTLSIRVVPADAEVFIDDERWAGPATSDRLNIRLAAGRHRVEVRKQGLVTYTEEVLIRQGATLTLNVSLR